MNKAATKAGPLSGWRVLITRATKQASALSEPLRQRGAAVAEIPTIEIHPPASYAALDQALVTIGEYNVLILTSVNGVNALFERCRELRLSSADLKHLLVVAIGPATAEALERQGLGVSIVPKRYLAESVVESLRGKISGDSRVLVVRAKVARDVLPSELRQMGAHVDVIEAYETKVPDRSASKLKEIFSSPRTRPHIVTFTSSSTVTSFLSLMGQESKQSLVGVCLASIGPVTSGTLKEAGLEPTVEAEEYTIGGLVDAISEFAAGHQA
jgi:uroporphyrinogen-III synthase